MSDLKSMLIRHEGLRLKPYADTAGKITVGVGRNLTDVGISTAEAMALLDRDITRAEASASSFVWFRKLDQVRQDVIADMIFNMGLARFCEFKRMIAALEKLDYDTAASEMLGSEWASQVKERADELAQMMRIGGYVA